MPDMKYRDSEIARRYAHVRGYCEMNRAAVKEMRRQVGDLLLQVRGIGQRGLLVRHLLLPGGLADSAKVLRYLPILQGVAAHPCSSADVADPA